MLDAFIIEEIRRREQERDNQRQRVDSVLNAPPDWNALPEPTPQRQNERREEDEEPQRGVIIIDYSVPADSIPA